MTRTEQAYVKRLDSRRETLHVALRIIHVWLISPWCARSAEEMCQLIARHVEQHLAEEEAAARKEAERQGGGKP
jgi:hypothetical protein